MKKLLIFFVILFAGHQAWSQATSCAQTLRLATSTYEQGRLHELEGILNNCLTGQGGLEFSKEEKVTAYKLLTQAYIYLEEPKKADETMLKLLETDHYFEVNPEIDPAEFVALYKTFRNYPVYAIGLKLGGGFSAPLLMTDYYTTSGSEGTGKYKGGLGFTVGLVFEKIIKNRIIFAPEILLASRRFSSKSNLFIGDLSGNPEGTIESTYKQNWIELNTLMQYEFGKGTLKTFLAAGPGIGYCIGSSKQTVTTGLSNNSVSGPDIDIKNSTSPLVYSLSVGAGFKYRIGGIIVHLEGRYQQIFNNVIKENARTNIENVGDYGDQLNDFVLTALTGTVGVSYPVFKPMKLKKK
jgi:hypothetical protein